MTREAAHFAGCPNTVVIVFIFLALQKSKLLVETENQSDSPGIDS
jgi:hypothetical protein